MMREAFSFPAARNDFKALQKLCFSGAVKKALNVRKFMMRPVW